MAGAAAVDAAIAVAVGCRLAGVMLAQTGYFTSWHVVLGELFYKI
jgi:hypothetical protein